MTTFTHARPITFDEAVTEMDRRGEVIERLEAQIIALRIDAEGYYDEAASAYKKRNVVEAENKLLKKIGDDMAEELGKRFAREDGKTTLDFVLVWMQQARDAEAKERRRADVAEAELRRADKKLADAEEQAS